MEQEIWKDIEEFGGRYQISNLGRVKSFAQEPQYGKIIRWKLSNSGYRFCMLTLGPKQRVARRISRLVAEAFVPNPNGYDTVDHINKNSKQNDCASNLQWLPHAENVRKDQAFFVECTHSVLGKHLVKGTRQAALVASCTRGNVQYAIRKNATTRTGWSFKIIK
jgi:hypothetical protein